MRPSSTSSGGKPSSRNSSFPFAKEALILAAAGLLDGYEATTRWTILRASARTPEDSRGGRLPAFRRGPRSRDRRWHLLGVLDEALEVIALLRGDDAAKNVQLDDPSITLNHRFGGEILSQAGTPPATSCPF